MKKSYLFILTACLLGFVNCSNVETSELKSQIDEKIAYEKAQGVYFEVVPDSPELGTVTSDVNFAKVGFPVEISFMANTKFGNFAGYKATVDGNEVDEQDITIRIKTDGSATITFNKKIDGVRFTPILTDSPVILFEDSFEYGFKTARITPNGHQVINIQQQHEIKITTDEQYAAMGLRIKDAKGKIIDNKKEDGQVLTVKALRDGKDVTNEFLGVDSPDENEDASIVLTIVGISDDQMEFKAIVDFNETSLSGISFVPVTAERPKLVKIEPDPDKGEVVTAIPVVDFTFNKQPIDTSTVKGNVGDNFSIIRDYTVESYVKRVGSKDYSNIDRKVFFEVDGDGNVYKFKVVVEPTMNANTNEINSLKEGDIFKIVLTNKIKGRNGAKIINIQKEWITAANATETNPPEISSVELEVGDDKKLTDTKNGQINDQIIGNEYLPLAEVSNYGNITVNASDKESKIKKIKVVERLAFLYKDSIISTDPNIKCLRDTDSIYAADPSTLKVVPGRDYVNFYNENSTNIIKWESFPGVRLFDDNGEWIENDFIQKDERFEYTKEYYNPPSGENGWSTSTFSGKVTHIYNGPFLERIKMAGIHQIQITVFDEFDNESEPKFIYVKKYDPLGSSDIFSKESVEATLTPFAGSGGRLEVKYNVNNENLLNQLRETGRFILKFENRVFNRDDEFEIIDFNRMVFKTIDNKPALTYLPTSFTKGDLGFLKLFYVTSTGYARDYSSLLGSEYFTMPHRNFGDYVFINSQNGKVYTKSLYDLNYSETPSQEPIAIVIYSDDTHIFGLGLEGEAYTPWGCYRSFLDPPSPPYFCGNENNRVALNDSLDHDAIWNYLNKNDEDDDVKDFKDFKDFKKYTYSLFEYCHNYGENVLKDKFNLTKSHIDNIQKILTRWTVPTAKMTENMKIAESEFLDSYEFFYHNNVCSYSDIDNYKENIGAICPSAYSVWLADLPDESNKKNATTIYRYHYAKDALNKGATSDIYELSEQDLITTVMPIYALPIFDFGDMLIGN